MKKIIFLLLMLLTFFISEVQSKERKFDVERIKNDTAYYCGQSQVFDSEEKAIESSLENLYADIATHCNPNAIYVGEADQKTQLHNIIRTFSIRISEKMLQEPIVYDIDKEEYSYFVYIRKSDFREICKVRKNNIERLALRGYNSEEDENLQIEDALKSYYWGMMLCVAHPYGNGLKIKIEEEQVDAYLWLKDRIDEVLSSFNFNIPKGNSVVEKDDGLMVTLNVTSTKGMPVSNLKFDYHNGQKYVPSAVNDGKAVVFLKDFDRSKLNIKIEYEFLLESTVDSDVNKVLGLIKHQIKFNNKHSIDLTQYLKKTIKDEDISSGKMSRDSNKNKSTATFDASFEVGKTDYLKVMQNIEKALRDSDYQSVKHYFTDEGYGMIDTLSRYGRITVVGSQEYTFLKFGNQVICRDINMQFDFRNHASFNRNVVFRFNDDSKKVESIAFRLSAITEQDIVGKSKWSKESRMVLINFLEDYQTAYALKRLDYLESIYSDDALIIVGHVVKRTVVPDKPQFNLSENEVRLMKYDKERYFQNLTRTFKSQEYINLRFAETDFTRARTTSDREVYGVRLLQEYYSSTYGDIGYLFLLVDLTDEKPVIHVRAWQPDEVDLDKLMGIKDLRL